MSSILSRKLKQFSVSAGEKMNPGRGGKVNQAWGGMTPWGRGETELIRVPKQKPRFASGQLALGSCWSHISWFIEIRSGCTEVAKPGRGGEAFCYEPTLETTEGVFITLLHRPP